MALPYVTEDEAGQIAKKVTQSQVVANPTPVGTTNLTGIKIDGTSYKIQSGAEEPKFVTITSGQTTISDEEVTLLKASNQNYVKYQVSDSQTVIAKLNSQVSSTTSEGLVYTGAYGVSPSQLMYTIQIGKTSEQTAYSLTIDESQVDAVEANPTATETTDLEKIKIGSVNYKIKAGTELPSITTRHDQPELIVRNVTKNYKCASEWELNSAMNKICFNTNVDKIDFGIFDFDNPDYVTDEDELFKSIIEFSGVYQGVDIKICFGAVRYTDDFNYQYALAYGVLQEDEFQIMYDMMFYTTADFSNSSSSLLGVKHWWFGPMACMCLSEDTGAIGTVDKGIFAFDFSLYHTMYQCTLTKLIDADTLQLTYSYMGPSATFTETVGQPTLTWNEVLSQPMGSDAQLASSGIEPVKISDIAGQSYASSYYATALFCNIADEAQTLIKQDMGDLKDSLSTSTLMFNYSCCNGGEEAQGTFDAIIGNDNMAIIQHKVFRETGKEDEFKPIYAINTNTITTTYYSCEEQTYTFDQSGWQDYALNNNGMIVFGAKKVGFYNLNAQESLLEFSLLVTPINGNHPAAVSYYWKNTNPLQTLSYISSSYDIHVDSSSVTSLDTKKYKAMLKLIDKKPITLQIWDTSGTSSVRYYLPYVGYNDNYYIFSIEGYKIGCSKTANTWTKLS